MSDELWLLLVGNIITFVGVLATIIYNKRGESAKQQQRHEENLVAMTKIATRLEGLEHLHECVDRVRDEVRQLRDMVSTINQRFTDHLELYRLRHDELSKRVDRVERGKRREEEL